MCLTHVSLAMRPNNQVQVCPDQTIGMWLWLWLRLWHIYGIWHMASWWLQWPQIGLWIRTWGGQRKSVLPLPFTFQLRTGWSHGTPNQNGQVSTSCESWTVQTSNVEKNLNPAMLLCHANVTVSMSSIVYDTMPLCHCATTACHEMLAASSSCCDMSHVLQSAFHGTQGLRPMTDLRLPRLKVWCRTSGLLCPCLPQKCFLAWVLVIAASC